MATSVVKIDVKKFGPREAELRAIVVRDADTCALAKRGQKDIRDELKQRHFVLDPFVVQAKIAYDNAKEERARWIDPLESLDGALAGKVKTWEREEREKAEQEQRREQERIRIETERKAAEERKAREKEIAEQRKAGELKATEAKRLLKLAEAEEKAAAANVPQIEVKPNIPTQAGVPSRRNWKFRIVRGELIPAKYRCPDEMGIGRMVRDRKDKKDAEAECPGIEVYED